MSTPRSTPRANPAETRPEIFGPSLAMSLGMNAKLPPGTKVSTKSTDFGMVPHTIYVITHVNEFTYNLRPLRDRTPHNDRCIPITADPECYFTVR